MPVNKKYFKKPNATSAPYELMPPPALGDAEPLTESETATCLAFVHGMRMEYVLSATTRGELWSAMRREGPNGAYVRSSDLAGGGAAGVYTRGIWEGMTRYAACSYGVGSNVSKVKLLIRAHGLLPDDDSWHCSGTDNGGSVPGASKSSSGDLVATWKAQSKLARNRVFCGLSRNNKDAINSEFLHWERLDLCGRLLAVFVFSYEGLSADEHPILEAAKGSTTSLLTAPPNAKLAGQLPVGASGWAPVYLFKKGEEKTNIVPWLKQRLAQSKDGGPQMTPRSKIIDLGMETYAKKGDVDPPSDDEQKEALEIDEALNEHPTDEIVRALVSGTALDKVEVSGNEDVTEPATFDAETKEEVAETEAAKPPPKTVEGLRLDGIEALLGQKLGALALKPPVELKTGKGQPRKLETLSALYLLPAGGQGNIQQHTTRVIRRYEALRLEGEFESHGPLEVEDFRLLLALHDIGKGLVAVKNRGITKEQHEVTAKIMRQVRKSLPLDDGRKLDVVIAVLDGDPIGNYLRVNANLRESKHVAVAVKAIGTMVAAIPEPTRAAFAITAFGFYVQLLLPFYASDAFSYARMDKGDVGQPWANALASNGYKALRKLLAPIERELTKPIS